MKDFNAMTQRHGGGKRLKNNFPLRLCFFALQSLGIIVRREDYSGARTALSACFCGIGAFARTKLSALLWLRLEPRCAFALIQNL
jgi:hypothetical protein